MCVCPAVTKCFGVSVRCLFACTHACCVCLHVHVHGVYVHAREITRNRDKPAMIPVGHGFDPRCSTRMYTNIHTCPHVCTKTEARGCTAGHYVKKR